MRKWLILAAAMLWSAAAYGQPLAEYLPADATVYVGWRGSEALGGEYDKSHLKAMAELTQIKQVLGTVWPKLMEKARQEDPSMPDAGPTFELLSEIIKYPMAIYVGTLEQDTQGKSDVRAASLIKVGRDAPSLLAKINQFSDRLVASGHPVKSELELIGTDYLGAGDAQTMARIKALLGQPTTAPAASQPVGPLAKDERFKQAMGRAAENSALVVYVDLQEVVDQVDKQIQRTGPDLSWVSARDAMGLYGLDQLVYSCGFLGPDIVSNVYVSNRGQRQGLLKLLEPGKVDPTLLKLVPKSSVLAMCGQLDLAETYGQIRQMAGTANAFALGQFDQALGTWEQSLGLRLQGDLLWPLGPGWALYVDPESGGDDILGMVVINKLRDPAKAQSSLERLAAWANQLLRQQMQDPNVNIQLTKTTYQGVTINYLAVPAVAPAWAVVDGNLYLGLYPQTVAAGIARAKAGGPSILENEQFLALRQRLGVPADSSFSFVDIPRTAPGSYGMVLFLTRLFQGVGDMMGVPTPPLTVPTLADIRPHLEPVGAFGWADEKGIHYTTLNAFPGDAILSPQQNLGLSSQMMMVGILLPSLGQARQNAQAMESSTKVRQLGMALLTYASNHQGRFPPDLAAVVIDTRMLPFGSLFVTRDRGRVRVPPDFGSWERPRQAAWLAANSSYLYLGGMIKGIPPGSESRTIVAIEKPHMVNNGTVAAAFADGHAQRLPLQQARQLIQQQTGMTLEQLLSNTPPPTTQASPSQPR
ncbi:MAG: hypothetical protein IT443_02140 [Phycisphaeraceae bacterium]|nr:hypothetical protein [Phycisphaeraceae bacterium]